MKMQQNKIILISIKEIAKSLFIDSLLSYGLTACKKGGTRDSFGGPS